MKIFWITLEETIRNIGEVEIMAEDEPTARKMARVSARIDWSEAERYTDITRVQELIDYDNEQ